MTRPPRPSVVPERIDLAIAADPDRAVAERVAAVRRIAERLDTGSIIPLAVIHARSEGALRGALGCALRALSATEVVGAELGSRDADRRVAAVRVLGMLEDPASVPLLLEALVDPHPRVREHAAGALLPLADDRAFEALSKQLVLDPDPDARGAAAQAIAELSHPDAARVLQQSSRREQDVYVVILIERALLAHSERAHRPLLAACG